MSSYLEVTPFFVNDNGVPFRFGATRYTIPDEMAGGALQESTYAIPFRQELRGVNPRVSTFIQFEVKVLRGDVPQPELAPTVIVKVEGSQTPQTTETVVSVNGVIPGPQPIGTLASLLLESLYDKAEELDS